ncbi:MAG TPA: mycofactocin-coupled SDR family oxidoreductase [Pseudonocardia sp.]
MSGVDGKVAIITGGARGQGRSHALRLAREGADIVVCDIASDIPGVPLTLARPDDLAQTVALVEAEDRRCLAIQADVRDTAQINGVAEAAMAEFGRIDILCANAGVLSMVDNSWEIDDLTWDSMIDVNLSGVFKSCRAVIPHMLAGGRGGAIVITSSIAGLKALPAITHYVAAKHGTVGLMRALARELAPRNIRVNTVHPAAVDSPMARDECFTSWAAHNVETANTMYANLMRVQAMQESDISDAVAFLVSDQAKWITGTTLNVDAGWLLT